jgi:hypothetical protein
MARTLRLGMLTPSSNTALEPLTQAMLAPLPETSAHFSRFRVTEIGLGDIAPRQFDDAPILRAAELLAETLERAHGFSVHDTVALAVWKSLLVAGTDRAKVQGWGSLFTPRRGI